jgi:CheY-like chemotaxis protein
MESKAKPIHLNGSFMPNHPPSPISILLIESDDETRQLLTENLTNRGYRVTVSLNATDAISRAQLDPSFDLILVNQHRVSADEAVAIGQRIRTDGGMAEQIPIIILADQYGEDLEGQNCCIGPYCYVAYLTDGQQLWDLMNSLCG